MHFLAFKHVCLVLSLMSLSAISDTTRWKLFERERNDGWVNISKFHGLPSVETRDKLLNVRMAKSYWLPKQSVQLYIDPLYQKEFDSHFQRLKGLQTEVFFAVHPSATQQFSGLSHDKTAIPISIEPSASLRTVFWGDKLLKLSLPQTLNGIDRSVYALQMERAVTISRLLSEIPETEQRQNHFGFLKEPAAIAMRNELNPYGFIIREIPDSIKNGPNTLASLVSFVSKDPKGGESLLEANLKKWTGQTPQQKVHHHLIVPLIAAFRFAAEDYGILLEAHQQNILLELDAEGIFTGRFYYRDLDGARVDVDVRTQRGLSNEWIYAVSNPEWVFQLSLIKQLNDFGIGGAKNYTYDKYVKGSILSLLSHSLNQLTASAPSSPKSLEAQADIEMLLFRGCGNFFKRVGN